MGIKDTVGEKFDEVNDRMFHPENYSDEDITRDLGARLRSAVGNLAAVALPTLVARYLDKGSGLMQGVTTIEVLVLETLAIPNAVVQGVMAYKDREVLQQRRNPPELGQSVE